MFSFPEILNQRLRRRVEENTLRSLTTLPDDILDLSSNDYLGLGNKKLETKAEVGSGGSRLISGNKNELIHLEKFIAKTFNSESALLFSSGYAANVGVLSAIANRGDFIIYDQYIHASCRDGISLSRANSYSFKHNDLGDLESHLSKHSNATGMKIIVTESVFSMNGTSPNLKKLNKLALTYNAYLIVDEAHAVGIQNEGLICSSFQKLDRLLAVILPFGKAVGADGAAVLGSEKLITYLINFARSQVFSTAISPLRSKVIYGNLEKLIAEQPCIDELYAMKDLFIKEMRNSFKIETGLKSLIIGVVVGDTNRVQLISKKLYEEGYFVKHILYPTVPKGEERLRICIRKGVSKNDIYAVTKIINEL